MTIRRISLFHTILVCLAGIACLATPLAAQPQTLFSSEDAGGIFGPPSTPCPGLSAGTQLRCMQITSLVEQRIQSILNDSPSNVTEILAIIAGLASEFESIGCPQCANLPEPPEPCELLTEQCEFWRQNDATLFVAAGCNQCVPQCPTEQQAICQEFAEVANLIGLNSSACSLCPEVTCTDEMRRTCNRLALSGTSEDLALFGQLNCETRWFNGCSPATIELCEQINESNPVYDILDCGSCNTQCNAYQFKLDNVGNKGNVDQVSYAPESPACLRNVVQTARNYCRTITGGRYLDDCVAASIGIMLALGVDEGMARIRAERGGRNGTDYTRFWLSHANAALLSEQGVYQRGGGRNIVHTDSIFYVDTNCSFIPRSELDEFRECPGQSRYIFKDTPISLLWNEDSNFEKRGTMVRFKLNPHSKKSWFQWKASADAPLIVFDPEHRGEIRSAEQLLGNWSFGGKKVAMLGTGRVSATPWKNGFEALESFDRDLDGYVRDEELKDLGLWFDRNQNGVSEPGEVLSMKDASVTSLSVSIDYTDNRTGSMYSLSGYARTIEGRTVVGKSVDWLGRGYDFKHEAGLQKEMDEALDLRNGGSSTTEEATSTPRTTAIGSHAESISSIQGVWEWSLGTDKPGTNLDRVSRGGFLILGADKDGNIEGSAFSGALMRGGNSLKISSAISQRALQGKVLASNDKRIVFTFEQRNNNTSKEKNNVTYDKKTQTLQGTSTETVVFDTGEEITQVYTWTATRLK